MTSKFIGFLAFCSLVTFSLTNCYRVKTFRFHFSINASVNVLLLTLAFFVLEITLLIVVSFVFRFIKVKPGYPKHIKDWLKCYSTDSAPFGSIGSLFALDDPEDDPQKAP